jgi:ribosome-associated translation inhibitor RaiA
LIEVRTGSSVKGSAGLDAFAEKIVTGGLSRFMPRVTRIDVHLSDANAERTGGDDKRCQIEVRPASQQPVSATATAATIEKALTSAVSKMKRLLAKRLDRRVRA